VSLAASQRKVRGSGLGVACCLSRVQSCRSRKILAPGFCRCSARAASRSAKTVSPEECDTRKRHCRAPCCVVLPTARVMPPCICCGTATPAGCSRTPTIHASRKAGLGKAYNALSEASNPSKRCTISRMSPECHSGVRSVLPVVHAWGDRLATAASGSRECVAIYTRCVCAFRVGGVAADVISSSTWGD
jgi:hypothetical protein